MATQLTLQVFKGEQLVTAKDFDRDIIKIGRLASAHLCLDDDKVSRIHSVIEVSAEGLMSIIDMGSVEGTYVNGKRVNKSQIAYGDEIKVGNTTIKVTTQAAAEQLQQVAAVGAQDEASTVPAAPEAVAHAAAAVEAAVNGRPALDPSFAPTQQNPVLPAKAAHRVVHERVRKPAAVAPAPAPRVAAAPAKRSEKSGPLGLSIRMMWGDQMLAEQLIKPGKAGAFTVGSAASVSFVMDDGLLGGPSFEAVKYDEHGAFQVRFNNKMRGELHRGGEPTELKQLIEAGQTTHDGDAYALSVDRDDFVWVDLGGITLEASFKPVPKPVLVPWTETIDFRALNILLLMLFAGSMFVITASNNALEGDEFGDELSADQARIAKLIIKPPDIKKNPLLERLNKRKEKAAGEKAAKHKKEEGQMGKKDLPKTNKHTAPQGKPDHKNQARMLAKKIFGSGGISTVFGKAGLGGELKSAMGSMFGAKAGNSGGFGGLGLKGSGGGGGGGGETIGIGGIGTKGRGGGTAGYGSGVGSLGGKQETDIGITSSEPMVSGSLDKELIRKVIHANRGQIRYCYETQLNRFPKLGGKVAVTFVISASGSVATSKASQNTTSNQELETCIVGRVKNWVFPKPKGGGSVIVTYPFIFKQAGG